MPKPTNAAQTLALVVAQIQKAAEHAALRGYNAGMAKDAINEQFFDFACQERNGNLGRPAIKEALDLIAASLAYALEGYTDGVEFAADMDAEACPGCGCQPGDGVTASCNHPDGCGEARLQEASAHDLTMAGI